MSREACFYNAKLAEQAERFDEMVAWVAQGAAAARDLSSDERTVLSVAFKNAVGARRASWRVIAAAEGREKANLTEKTEKLAARYRVQVEGEIRHLCAQVTALVNSTLLPASSTPEARVTYLKMRGDYHRYLAEIAAEPERTKVAADAAAAYAEAAALAETLSVASPLRLALALNRSVFYFEILADRQQATALAREAFEAATAQGERALKDAAVVLQLLRDNLTLWAS